MRVASRLRGVFVEEKFFILLATEAKSGIVSE